MLGQPPPGFLYGFDKSVTEFFAAKMSLHSINEAMP